MAKKFNIHDWQAKQRLNEIDMDNVFMKGVGPGGEPNPDQLTDEPLRDELERWVGGRFASWMSPGHPPFSQEYNKPPYFNDLIDGIMDIVDRGNLEEMNTTGGGASFNAGSGEGYMTPNAFKKKNKED